MMMKKLIATLWFILAVAWPSVAMATNTPDLIHNKVCISVLPQIEKCAEVDIYYWSQTYACQSITSSGSIVKLDKYGNWSMTFTCEASDGGKHDFKIDCKNWHIWSASNVSSYSYTCDYWSQHSWQVFDVSCIVDGEEEINPACIKEIWVDYGLYWRCWNWIIEAGEECDVWNNPNYNWSSLEILGYLDYFWNVWAWQFANKWYYCKNCKIISGGNYVYEPAECLYTDTPISIMNNEILPYWWRLWINGDSQVVASDDYCKNVQYDESYEKWDVKDKTILRKNSMICHFAVYNWNHNQNSEPIKRFSEKCYNTNMGYRIYEYFWQPGSHHSKADWASLKDIQVATNEYSEEEFWEYKLVLEKVDYEYCNKKTKTWTPWIKYWAICEVNFAVTRPYIMQISTFGVNPVATNGKEFLYDFYDMNWDPILKKTDLSSVISTDNTSYAVDYRVDDKFNEFSNKYEKLAVEIKSDFVIQTTKWTKATVWNLFEADKSYKIKKVPNQSIYFIEWKDGGTLTLSQDKINNLTAAYTIIVKWMDVEIVWNVLQYAMIVTDGTMSFKDAWWDSKLKTSCANWWQVVQGIYVAVGGFEIWEKILNNSKDEYRCPWWWLHVKWVLIWSNVEELMESKRSQLNSWFNASSSSNANRERRQKIIEWAALLIEYSPSLWKTLPPWAEIFTESLEVYRK